MLKKITIKFLNKVKTDLINKQKSANNDYINSGEEINEFSGLMNFYDNKIKVIDEVINYINEYY